MKSIVSRLLGPGISVVLFAVAVWLLHGELRDYHAADIWRAFQAVPPARIWAAIGLTVLSYGVMTGYDTLALAYIRHPLSYSRIGMASFIGYAFSNNVGLSMIAGASVRYRLYSAWGLSTLQITRVVAFCAVTLWLGFFILAGTVFLVEPLTIPEAFELSRTSLRAIGIVMLAVVCAFGIATAARKTPVRIRDWEIPLPSFRLFVFQIGIAALDWTMAGMVLFVLLNPGDPSLYPAFLGSFLLAQLLGLISQVPGGLGVFESVLLLLLSSRIPANQIFGALLAYRALYYWLPLGIAALLLGTQEILRGRERMGVIGRLFEQWTAPLAPQVFAFAAFTGGAILLFSGATPGVEHRLAFLKDLIPLPFLELSHFAGSIAGMGLLLLGRGLQRRLDAAYHLATGLLIAGILASIAKGFDYEEAIALSLILIAILPMRRHFYRKASLFSQRFDAGWAAAILIVLGCSVWLGFYSYRHVEYSDDLWWRFTFRGDASRFLRATVGAAVCALFFAAARLLRPAAPRAAQPGTLELEKVEGIVRESPHTPANLALLGDKRFLFSPEGDAFIMYQVEGRDWIAMGDPVGPEPRWRELIWDFRELSDQYGGRAVFYEVKPDRLHLYLDMGLSLLKIGEEARIPLDGFSLEGSSHKNLRHTLNKFEREGCRFEIAQPPLVADRIGELQRISNAWLEEKNSSEKGFSLGFFHPDYIQRCPVALVIRDNRIEAFANLWTSARMEEVSIDLMRYLPGVADGVMEYLFLRLILWGKEQGYHWFNLGMAPLSGLDDRALSPAWNRLGAFVFRHGEHFYNFQGLRRYKDKFDPVWRPKYLASPGGWALPQVLAGLTALVSRGPKGIVTR